MLGVRFVTAYGRRPLHALGTLAVLGGGLAALLTCAAAVGWLVTDTPGFALATFVAAGVAATLSGQALVTGLLAELVVANLAHTSEPFEVTETLGLGGTP